MTSFAILNVETGDFYSESPALKNEAKYAGSCHDLPLVSASEYLGVLYNKGKEIAT